MKAADIVTKIYTDRPVSHRERRDWWQAVKHGFSQRCPHCGKGRMFYKYLKPLAACEACSEELHHHRADDAPPYVTIVIIGHILGAIMLTAHERNLNLSPWTEAIVYPVLGLLLAVWLLPKVKGALIGYQWALRMHGFDNAASRGSERA